MQTCKESEDREIDLNGVPDGTITDAERRAWARFPTNDAARMRVVKPLGQKAAEIRVLDVSQGGLKLRVPANLQPGTIIQIELENAAMLAEVRYCARAELGFIAGVQLQDVSWTGE